eukprot:jgi/Psemu1/217214/e_gw1.841.10.1
MQSNSSKSCSNSNSVGFLFLGVAVTATVTVIVLAVVFVVVWKSRLWLCLRRGDNNRSGDGGDRPPLPPSYSYSCHGYNCCPNNHNNHNSVVVVPFVVLNPGPIPIRQRLRSVVEAYQREGSRALQGLSAMLEAALDAEDGTLRRCGSTSRNRNKHNDRRKLLSSKIQTRIDKTAACLEHDERVLARLLLSSENFSPVVALPGRNYNCNNNNNDNDNDEPHAGNHEPPGRNRNRKHTWYSKHKHTTPPAQRNESSSSSDTNSYDSATQILAHLVRDWTVEGRPIRRNLYGWCRRRMELYCPVVAASASAMGAASSSASATTPTVLVPGAGMGRLAYDLSRDGYAVEANELSLSMAAAAAAVLRLLRMHKHKRIHTHNGATGSSTESSLYEFRFHFHPYLLDGMANEVDSERRFKPVRFPDASVANVANVDGGCGSLSYTVGDFVGNNDVYYRRQRVGQFDAVVTCFFIDTATNIYEYVETIRRLLRPETGVWINVGPVQWHHNAILRPSVDELKDLIEASGLWSIKEWSVDTTPVSYRDENDHKNDGNENDATPEHALPRMTSFDGYRPLRFVAIRVR